MNEEDSQFRFQRDDRKKIYLWNQILSYLGFVRNRIESWKMFNLSQFFINQSSYLKKQIEDFWILMWFDSNQE